MDLFLRLSLLLERQGFLGIAASLKTLWNSTFFFVYCVNNQVKTNAEIRDSNNNFFLSFILFLLVPAMPPFLYFAASFVPLPIIFFFVSVSVILHGHMQTGVFVIVITYSFLCRERVHSPDAPQRYGRSPSTCLHSICNLLRCP